MIRLLLTLVLIAFATQGDASLIVVSGGAGSAESGGGSGGWSVDTGAGTYLDTNEIAGTVSSYPMYDLFTTNITNRDEVPAVGSVAWGATSSGWDGERSLTITYGSNYADEDDVGLAARGGSGSPGSAGIPATRRFNVGYLIKWDATDNGYGIGDSSKAFWVFIRNDAGNRPGGFYRPSAVGMNYSGISGFPSLDSGYDYQLMLPMLGVNWPHLPFIASSEEVTTFAPRPSNGNTWFWWEFEVNLTTGLIAWFATEENGTPVLMTGYNMYDPPECSEGPGGPGAACYPSGYPPALDADAQSDTEWWIDAMLQSWYGKHSPSRGVSISHYAISNSYIGPPAGFASSYDRPTVSGRSYTLGIYSGTPTLTLEAADQP